MNELVKNVSRKIPEAVKPLQVFLEAAPPLIVKDPEKIQLQVKKLTEKKDQIILQAAINSQVKFMATGNLKHFSVFNLQILSPAKVVKLFKL
ncbi:MAG: hypothetical protein UV54_C0044G0004 [Candidatus Beckwithbacteria bacterium GW2011_GWA2_43_10]|uniref:PIN domain-containing protein n=1 Tax=Candidatus Beckwithbacteria bacterium GW2011_GWA2_43_10 TaxID=1618369 RepID=A0A0G1C079_9BACT|nr:MAG: hypothetical protein UV54_C0044G0004 [Candidatus Beckwithbacteria bacterium GW2011_GWA2_43_10]